MSFKKNLKDISKDFNLAIPENLTITENSRNVILIDEFNLTRLFVNSGHDIKVDGDKVYLNTVCVLHGSISSSLTKRTELMLEVSNALY